MHATKCPKIMSWNAQSITNKSKAAQLEYLVNKENIDILLLIETFLKPHHTFHIKNYTVYRNDRLTHPHGGVAIAIKNNIPHKLCAPINTSSIENIAIEVKINNVPTRIVVAYSPKYSIYFSNDIALLASINSQYMIFGDLNAKHLSWNCNSNNRSGIQLFGMQQLSHFMVFYPPDHTHYPHSGQSPSTIDLLLTNANFAFDLHTHHNHISSDHAPVVCDVHGITAVSTKVSYDYQSGNWFKYRRIIDRNIAIFPEIVSTADIDNSIVKFTNLITLARSSCIPIKHHNAQHQLSSDTRDLIKLKNHLKRQWQRSTSTIAKQQLKSIINKLQKQINLMVNRDINLHWDNKLRNIKKGCKKIWNLAKQFRGKADSYASKIQIAGLPATGDADRANCLAQIFEKAHKITANYNHPNDINVRTTLHNFKAFSFLNRDTPNIDINEIQSILKQIKPFKSPGPDSIPNILLKKLPASAVEWLTDLMNKCIKLSYWPQSFKIAKVIPILKSSKAPSEAQSYRPISLLNSMGKILERVIYSRIIEFVEEKNLLPSVQFGFRRGHSTTHQAMRIKKFIMKNKRLKKSVGLLLLDIEKAFDSVWHDGLIHKLIQMKFPAYLIKMIDAFIRNRKFIVHVNDAKSNYINIPAGLAQGTCISPILYALYIADMPIPTNTQVALYADDTGVYTAAKQSNTIVNRLNESMNSIEAYLRKWRIKANASKTQAILFTFDNKRRRVPSIRLSNSNQTINLQSSVNYLGIIFDKKLTFKEHITNSINKANKCFRALYPMLAPKSKLSTINKMLIYSAVIRPIMAYGSPIWSSAAYTHTHKYNILQNKVLKTILGLPIRTPSRLIEKLTQIPQFTKFIDSVNNNFLSNCNLSDFYLIQEIDSI